MKRKKVEYSSWISEGVIRSLPGDKLVFLFPNNGYELDCKKAKSLLTVGDVYVVERIHVDRNYTDIYLEGFEGSFNSCHFIREDDYLKSQEKKPSVKRIKARFNKTSFEKLNLYDQFIFDSCLNRASGFDGVSSNSDYVLLMKINSFNGIRDGKANARDSKGKCYNFFNDDEVIKVVP